MIAEPHSIPQLESTPNGVATGAESNTPPVRRTAEREVFGVIVLMALILSYSEEIVAGLFDAFGQGEKKEWRIALVFVDLAILAWVGWLKRSIGRSEDAGSRLWRWWWAGFVIVIALDVLLSGLEERPPAWIDLVAETLFAGAMGVLTMSSLNADPLTLFSSSKRARMPRDWLRVRAVVPLVLGTFAAYTGAMVFVDFLNVDVVRTLDPATAAEVANLALPQRLSVLSQLCSGAVSSDYFRTAVYISPVLLLALGVEFNYFRRAMHDPAQRAATTVVVTVMSVGLVCALSTLPFSGKECGHVWLLVSASLLDKAESPTDPDDQ
jgi:hypothetical protein